MQAARAEEMLYVKKRKVYDKVPRSEADAVIPVGWVDTNKGTSEVPIYRSRIVGKEFKRKSIGEATEMFAATPPLEGVKAVISRAATGNWRSKKSKK